MEQDDDASCSERSGISSLCFDKSDDSKDGIEYRFRIADDMHQKITYGILVVWLGSRSSHPSSSP